MGSRNIIGASNSDTALKVVASKLNSELKHTFSHFLPTLNFCPENSGEDRTLVSIASKSIADDLEELIVRLNHDKNDILLPQIIIGKSNEIQPSRFGKTSGKMKFHKEFTFKNEADDTSIILRGQSFTYETPIQIVVLGRAGFEVTSLGLAIINILANHKVLKYDIFAQSETQKYRLKDICTVKTLGADMATFSESTTSYNGFIAIATELSLQNEYLMLTVNESIMKKYKVQDQFGGELYVDASE